MDIRRAVQRMLYCEFPRVVVLAYQELSPDMNIQPIARISMDLPGTVRQLKNCPATTTDPPLLGRRR